MASVDFFVLNYFIVKQLFYFVYEKNFVDGNICHVSFYAGGLWR